MREVKYEAWDNEKKCWCTGKDEIFLDSMGRCWQVNQTNPTAVMNLMPVARFSIRFYTGLKDKKGRDIYEGDIVKCANGDVWAVRYDEEEATFEFYDNVGNSWSMSWWNAKMQEFGISKAQQLRQEGEMEVIGNLHEHPDLLAPKQKDCGADY